MGLLGWLFSLVNPLKPVMDAVAQAYTGRAEAKTDQERIASDERIDWTKQQAETQIAAMSHDSLLSPRSLISYAVAIYVVKLLVWDTVLGLGVTRNPGDIVNWIAAEVIAALFVSKTASTLAGAFSSALARRAGK